MNSQMPKEKDNLEKKLANLSKKKFPSSFQKLLIALIIIVVLIIVNQQIKDSKKLPKTDFFNLNQNQEAQNIQNIIYVGPDFSLQPTFPIFETTKLEKENLVDFFVKKYNFLKNSQVEDLYVNDKYFLNVDKGESEYYSLSLHQPPNLLPFGLKKDQALEVGKQLIQDFFPNSQLVAQINDINYLKGGYMIDPTTKEEATYIQIPYTYQLNNLPIFYKKDSQFPFLLTLSSEYELVKLEFSPFFLEFNETNNFNSLNLETVLNNININKKAVIMDPFDQNEVPIDSQNIVSGKLLSYKLEYRLDETNNLAFPVINFLGNFKNNQGEEFKAKLITPTTK
jgi:hypothetical protein